MAPRLPRPHRDDVLIAAGGLLGGLLLLGAGLRTGHDPTSALDRGWAILIPLAVTAGCELLRRTRPRAALATGTVAIVADLFTRGSLATTVMFTDLVYAAVLYGSAASARRIPWIMGVLTVLGTVVPFALWRTPQSLLIGAAVALLCLGPAATGWVVRNHRDTAVAERLRAEQTALLAELDRTQAVTEERARMARELHDLVANHLSAIAIHSTAALSLNDEGTSKEALAVIRENSVAGLAEMRRLIGILRAPGPDGPAGRDTTADAREPAATPSLDGLGALVDRARAGGLDIVLDASWEEVPVPVELAAYRIVQESLTNALKHARPGRITIRLAQRDGVLHVRVSSPYGERSWPRAPGSGAGLVGMRERAALLGGTFEAGPEGPSWTVRAGLPLAQGDPA
ncbi:sensor histidine kinase [Streptomyces nodosus]